MRSFIALEVGEQVQKKCLSIIENLKHNGYQAKWVEVENLHITLFFLGDIANHELEKTACIIRRLNAKPFQVIIDKISCFQKATMPTSVWLGIKPCEPLHDLYASMRSELKAIFNKTFDHKFIPHLTLGRIKKVPNDWKAVIQKITVENIQIGKVIISLKSSKLTEKGPIYKTLEAKAI
ncbi:MAG TPA: RNA 2',3'-cyclic phosphodiesterase [Thermotogota bacterium]|nr:RNA 2',3'-cyclic phosphodiesterase [Thermotogota bacterium]HRW33897.1 RNA 2',3'-cyclic phosphodiesterase [Thermotogota bacterium]